MPDSHLIPDAMRLAIEEARRTMNADQGGPFGAAVLDQNGSIIAVSSNTVLKDHDATAHAEMNAIRKAGAVLGTHDLSGCTLVTTAYPCPMCLGAIIWSNITKIIYGCRPDDADAIGFRDDMIYTYIRHPEDHASLLETKEQYRDECLSLFVEYDRKNKTIY
ncbi:MAG: nucleoside deaminase [Acholeplasmataceae bacterium]|nr:nucleoside deaminase [Acholeplasmataceae bacterium]